jgi:O-methyltransferase domain/Dimerisation domain
MKATVPVNRAASVTQSAFHRIRWRGADTAVRLGANLTIVGGGPVRVPGSMPSMENTVQLVSLERLQLLQMIMGFRVTQLLHVAAKLGLADLLHAGPQSAQTLAAHTRCNPDALYRVLRALTNIGIFNELPQRHFELTPLGASLRSDSEGSLRDAAVLYGEAWLWNAYAELMYSVRTGEPAFDAVHGMSFFSYLREAPTAGERFNAAMSAFSAQETAAVVAAYDFTPYRVIADIGGGHGRLLAAILDASPEAQGMLFDLPQVCAGARPMFEATGLFARTTLVGGDFFRCIPPGAHLYVLKSVIHDWDDEKAQRILANCRAAMTPQARLLLIERVVGEANEIAEAKLFDINMLAMVGGRERTRGEYRALLGAAGFRLTRILATASPLSIIEAAPIE